MLGRQEPRWVQKFRNYGLPLCYILYMIVFWLFYKRHVITSECDQHFSTVQTVWIWTLRATCWLSIPLVLAFFLTVLLYKTPPRTEYCKRDTETMTKAEVHALILRIVTIGNYRRMIENSISYHSDLIKRYLKCDHFSIHVVTEKPLNLQASHPSVVRQIVVPQQYVTKSGSLGKARNLAYWLESDQLGDLPADRTWIIDIDEDVILTSSLMRSLTKGFFREQTVPKIGLPQVLITLGNDSGYLNKLIQVYRFSIDLADHWATMVLLGHPPAVCHGGCFVARADCSMDKNAECGPFCSISDDNAYMLSMVAKGVKVEFIDGWFYEDAPTSNEAAMVQRERWQRGHVYLARWASVPRALKLGVFSWCFGATVIAPIAGLARSLFLIIALLGQWNSFFPAGVERPFIGDTLTALVLATHVFSVVYGLWFLLPWKEAFMHSLFALTGVPSVILYVTDIFVAYATLKALVKEAISGKTGWNVTVKRDEPVD